MGKLINYIKEEEFFKLVKAEKKDKFKLAYKLAFGSGLRISEIIGYKRKSPQGKNLDVLSGSTTDALSGKSFELPVEIQPLTKEQIDFQAKTIKVIGGKGMKDRIVPLFPGFKESDLKLLPLNIKRSTLQAHFKALGKKVLGRDITFHQLRHGFGVASTKKRVPMPFIQQAMGHSRLDTTGIYTAASPEDMLEGYKRAWGEI